MAFPIVYTGIYSLQAPLLHDVRCVCLQHIGATRYHRAPSPCQGWCWNKELHWDGTGQLSPATPLAPLPLALPGDNPGHFTWEVLVQGCWLSHLLPRMLLTRGPSTCNNKTISSQTL